MSRLRPDVRARGRTQSDGRCCRPCHERRPGSTVFLVSHEHAAGLAVEDFDPAADLTPGIRRMMGGDERVTAWAARQRAKALHVGTYEAAVHNMLRRM